MCVNPPGLQLLWFKRVIFKTQSWPRTHGTEFCFIFKIERNTIVLTGFVLIMKPNGIPFGHIIEKKNCPYYLFPCN